MQSFSITSQIICAQLLKKHYLVGGIFHYLVMILILLIEISFYALGGRTGFGNLNTENWIISILIFESTNTSVVIKKVW